jgi:molybdopterin guanine dinucleotide-containing S/N-oxide reductase-like protein
MALSLKYICPFCSDGMDTAEALSSHIKNNHKEADAASPVKQTEKSVIKGLATNSFGHGGAAARVESKNGRIIRIRPLHYDESYTPAEVGQWKVEARGKVFESKMKTLPNPHGLGYKKRVYSPNRIKYPLKRVDWDPNGERNPQNRGRSKYKRISWDEATTLIADEVKRIRAKYGPYAIFLQGDGHGETKIIHAPHGCQTRMFDMMSEDPKKGDYTLQIRTPDSWEGWKWGATHMWGMEPQGLFRPSTNTFKDIAENTDMLFFWGADWETTAWQYGGQDTSLWAFFYRDIGIKMVFVSPDLNYAGAIHADKWIPVLPNTDAALLLALSYVWIAEDTYDKDYIATHTHAFDKYKDYVIGKEDGVPKTPQWASPLCGVPVWTIKALARAWASKRATFASLTAGPLCRGTYSTEPTRLQVACQAMQGMGKPGTHRFHFLTMPRAKVMLNPYGAYHGMEEAKQANLRWYPKQHIPKSRVCDAILDHSKENPMKWYSTGAFLTPTRDQFNEYQYPVDGCSEIHMIWTDTPCWQTCWNEGNRIDKAFRSPKVETIIAQHPWLENDTIYADIILPTCTKFELQDIMVGWDSFHPNVFPEGQSIEPIGESMSDYEAVCEVAKKLGVYEKLNEGKTVEEWMKIGYEKSGIRDFISWEKLKEKGFYCVPPADGWENDPPGVTRFYKDPENHPLTTETGKIEFEATDLLKHFPNDEERPPVPHWIPYGKTHQESLLHPRAKDYPLLAVSNHPRWRMHANLDDVSWFREIQTCKVLGWDGYKYEPCWIHPSEAARRNIENGDIVKVFNERGTVLCGAYVTERMMPSSISVDHGARVDHIAPGLIDRGGAINLITPAKTTSPNTQGQVASAFLVQVEKVTKEEMDAWKKKYPDAFNREYDPDSGLRFNSWVEGGL